MADTEGLPGPLLRNLADSQLEVLSWDASAGVLLARLTKDIGPEMGIIRLSGVTHINLPHRLHTVEMIECGGTKDLPRDYLATYRPDDAALDPEERIFSIRGNWGERFFVIAERLEYRVDGP